MANRILHYLEPRPAKFHRELIWEHTRAYSFRRYQRVMAWRYERAMRRGFWIGVATATVCYVIIEQLKN